MNILCHVENYPPYQNSGAETYLHSINKFLVSRGHTVNVMMMKRPWAATYTHDGVNVFPIDGHYGSRIVDSDIVITHLDATFDTWKMVKRKPILWICHSGFDFPTVRTHREINVLYNSHTIVEMARYPNPHYVLTPPVDIDYFNVCQKPEKNEFITLVNMNDSKGGGIFWRIAEMMPDKKFLGVKGSYGNQLIGAASNVTVIENTSDMREVYSKTRILLMPSRYESYGMVGLEGMANGIPVIAHDGKEVFGLKENLGYAGIFINRDQPEKWVEMIRKLDNKVEYGKVSKLSRKRAEEQRAEGKLEMFEEHLHVLAGKQKQTHVSKQEYTQHN